MRDCSTCAFRCENFLLEDACHHANAIQRFGEAPNLRTALTTVCLDFSLWEREPQVRDIEEPA